MEYTGDNPFSSVSEAQKFLENYFKVYKNRFGRWPLINKKSGNFVGWCRHKLNEESFVDLGFRFYQNEWGKGYATESAFASLEYGFNHLNLQEIIGRASIDNKASINVLEKLGMKFWKKDNCKGIENSAYYRLNTIQYRTK